MSKIKDYGVFDIDHRPIAVQLGLRAVDTVSKRKLLRRRGYNAHHLCLLFRQKTNVHPKFRFPQYKFYPKVKSPPLSRFRTKIPKLSSSQALSLSLSLSSSHSTFPLCKHRSRSWNLQVVIPLLPKSNIATCNLSSIHKKLKSNPQISISQKALIQFLLC